MDKEKQIEEIAKLFCDYCHEMTEEKECCYINEKENLCFKNMIGQATKLYNAGYRKIPENARVFIPYGQMVLLSREEAERFRGQTINIAKIKSQERKETAEKILKAVLEDVGEFYAGDIVEELAKTFDIEIKE